MRRRTDAIRWRLSYMLLQRRLDYVGYSSAATLHIFYFFCVRLGWTGWDLEFVNACYDPCDLLG